MQNWFKTQQSYFHLTARTKLTRVEQRIRFRLESNKEGFFFDDLIVFNSKKFWEYVKGIYHSQLSLEKTNQSDNLASYLDLTFTVEKDGTRSIKLYDKCNDFDFYIVNFPFLSSNIPSGPSYRVYMLQLIRYARCCSYYDDFRNTKGQYRT